MWVSRDHYLPPPADHAIVPVWESTVIPAAIRLFNAGNVEMTSLVLLQRVQPIEELESGEEPYGPRIILWIGVEPGSLTTAQAHELVVQAASMLASHSTSQIYVECHKSKIDDYSSPPFLPDAPRSSTREMELPFQLGTGWSIAPVSQPSSRATGGLFITLEGLDGAFLVSCQHALTPHNALERRLNPLETGEAVTLLSDDFFDIHLDNIAKARDDTAELIDECMRAILDIHPDDEAKADREGRLHVQLSERHQDLANLHRLLTQDWSERDARIVGTVSCHPAIDKMSGYTSNGFEPSAVLSFISDWGLIKLNPEIDIQTISPNIVRLPERLPRNGPFTFAPGTLRGQAVTVTEILPTSVFNGTNTPCYKQGAATGGSTGITHPIAGVKREKCGFDSDGVLIFDYQYSLALPIQGPPGKDFSAPGDSGSVVIDQEGRAIAMIMAGNRDNQVTFALPIDIMFQHIEDFTGHKPRLI